MSTERFTQALMRPTTWQPLLLSLLAFLLYGTLSTLQWNAFFFPSWDLGIFAEAVKAYAHFEAPIVPIKADNYHLLGDHFHPVLVLLAPLWWLWPSPLMLLWAQAALYAASVFPLAQLAMKRLGNRLGLLAGASYAFSFGLQSGQNVQFHEYAFGVLFLAYGLTALVERRITATSLWLGALVFVKEDLGLTVMVLGLVAAWLWRDTAPTPPQRTRTDTRTLPQNKHGEPSIRAIIKARALSTINTLKPQGTQLALWGIAWFCLATWVILPLFNPEGSYAYTSNFGGLNELFGPWVKWQTALMFIAFMGIAGLTSPIALALLPTLAWRFSGNVENYWNWQWHYNSILMPIACAALIVGVSRISGALVSGYYELRDRTVDRTKAALWSKRAAIALSILSTAYLSTALPLTWIATGAFNANSDYAQATRDAIAAVPEGVTVATDIHLMAPLVSTNTVQWKDGPNKGAPQCVAATFGANEQSEYPKGWAGWASQKWPATSQPQMENINGARIPVTAAHPYTLIFANGYFQVVCQQPA